MLSTIALVAAGLTGGQKVGLAVVAAAFIGFALVSSFVMPRRNPNFPGKGMGWYLALAALFFVAMIAAVLVFGKEHEDKSSEPAGKTQTTAAAPTTTAAAATTTSGGSVEVKGDPAAGKTVFANAGCAGCHTLKAAGASGNVGPNLDDLKPAEDRVKAQVEHGGGPMPAYKGQLTDKQIQDVAAFVFASTHTG